jgi:hypothetical protein
MGFLLEIGEKGRVVGLLSGSFYRIRLLAVELVGRRLRPGDDFLIANYVLVDRHLCDPLRYKPDSHS